MSATGGGVIERAGELDRALLVAIHRDLATGPTDWLARALDPPAVLLLLVALAAAWAFLASGRRPRAAAAVLASALAAGGLGALVLKPLVDRPRPAVAMDGLRAEALPEDAREGPSFPSSHAVLAFAAAAAILAAVGRRAGALALAAAAVVAGSRMTIGMHYPSDVLGGAAVGVACGLAVARVVMRRGALAAPQPATPP